VDVLAANDAIRDVFCDRVEIFLADAAFLERGAGLRKFAIFLEPGLEEGGGAAYQVFVDSEALVDIGDSETHDFAAEAMRNMSDLFYCTDNEGFTRWNRASGRRRGSWRWSS
jgi:hypothetical protein